MFCPNCGKDNSATKKFCTSCGLKLQSIVQALTTEQSSNQETYKPLESKQKRRQQAILPGLFLILTGIIISLIGADGFASKAITDIGVIVAIIGMGLIGYKGIQNSNRSKSAQNSPTIQTNAQTVPLLSSPIVEPISITEHTTRELNLSFGSNKKST